MSPNVVDPVTFIKEHWPDVYLYDKQRQVAYSLWENDETFVPAGNMLGKDFVSGLLVLAFFLSRNPCRILTTSVDATQLNAVLWGEIRRFIQTAKYPLSSTEGGPLVINDLHIRKIVDGKLCGLSYILGRVANQTGEGMLGHHIAKTGDGIPRTLFVADEASGVPHIYYDKADTWADRKIVIGNCFDCDNFFRYAVEGRPGTNDHGGDIPRTNGVGFFRKVITIQATDSPNVQYALKQRELGYEPDNSIIVPGVKSWDDFQKNLVLWDEVKKEVSLYARFYRGSENLLFPLTWLDRANTLAASLSLTGRKARAIGVDPAEGGDKTSWSVVDDLGLMYQLSKKTPDTAVITAETLAMMHRFDVPAEQVLFDSGGGGKQHADRLREQGHNVRTIGFGETVMPPPKRMVFTPLDDKIENKEERYVYKNRRAEMYGELSLLLDPGYNPQGFAIPSVYTELRRQLAPMPRLYDPEGRLRMLPKNKRDKTSKELTLLDLLGCSPDEADSLVLAVYGLVNRSKRATAGAAW